MDISFNTVEYLMSNSVYKKINENTDLFKNKDTQFRNDIKFYKKRIYQTTKELIKQKIDKQHIDKEVDIYLTNYLRALIDYFKFDDKKDILQEEFKHLNKSNKKVMFDLNENKNLESMNTLKANEIIMKQPEIKENTIESTMNVKIIRPPIKKQELPRSKTIELKSDHFKTKGLKNPKK